jgi:hypothetical protein
MAIAAIRRIEQLSQTVVAHSHIRRDERADRAAGDTLDDAEAPLAARLETSALYSENPGEWGCLLYEAGLESHDV